MRKCLFSAPDGPAGPGAREIHLVPPPTPPAASPAAADVSPSATVTASGRLASDHPAASVSASTPVKGEPSPVAAHGGSAADGGSGLDVPAAAPAAPTLVWPPPDEELDDWHVIPLRRPEPAAPETAAAAPEANGGAPAGTASPDVTSSATSSTGLSAMGTSPAGTSATGPTATSPKKPLPAWLANHRASQAGPAGSPSSGAAARTLTASPSSNAARAVAPSPLEDTARFSDETTTAIAVRRQGAGSSGAAPAVNLAQVAQPVARPVAAFPSERRRPMPMPQPRVSPWNTVMRRAAVVVLALLAVGQAAYIGARLFFSPVSALSILTIDSNPDGAEVIINGERRGVTPFKVELPAGEHAVELRKNGRTRSIPVTLAAGIQASQYVELGSAPAAATGPAAAPVPAPAATPAPLAPPRSATVIPPPSEPSPSPADLLPTVPSRGWVEIQSALNLRVLRNGELLGSSDEGRLSLPAGRQELEVVNDAVGFRAITIVQVPPGRTLTMPVELPQSLLNITATPSARAWVDGREVGNTPITQLALPVGQHEVRFEHPEYGERRMTILVRVGATAQASVDFTR